MNQFTLNTLWESGIGTGGIFLKNCEEELIMHDGSILIDENYGKNMACPPQAGEERRQWLIADIAAQSVPNKGA